MDAEHGHPIHLRVLEQPAGELREDLTDKRKMEGTNSYYSYKGFWIPTFWGNPHSRVPRANACLCPPRRPIVLGCSSPSRQPQGSMGPVACPGPPCLAVVAFTLRVPFRALVWGRLMFGPPGRGGRHAGSLSGYSCVCHLVRWCGRLMFGPPSRGGCLSWTPPGYAAQHPIGCLGRRIGRRCGVGILSGG